MDANKGPKHLRNLISRVLIVISSIVLILWQLPRNEHQTFNYDVGKPWPYGSFIAQFDFPILKSQELQQHEEDSVDTHTPPFYTINKDVEEEQVTLFRKLYQDGIPNLPLDYVDIISNRLHRAYHAGIMESVDYNLLAADTTLTIRVIEGKKEELKGITFTYSVDDAVSLLYMNDEQEEEIKKCHLERFVVPNLTYDRERSESERAEIKKRLAKSIGNIVAGQKIIDRGEIVSEETDRILQSFEQARVFKSNENDKMWRSLIGQIIFVIVIMTLFTGYLALFRRDYFEHPRSILMLYGLVALFPIISSLLMKHSAVSIFIIPFCIVPIFVRVFMDSRTAFLVHITAVTLSAIVVSQQYEFLIIQIIAGMISIQTLREMTRRAQVLKTAFLVAVTSCAVYLALQMMQNTEVLNNDAGMYISFGINGVLILLSYPLMYLFEKLFGFMSDVTLFELSNTNQGVLRKLSEVAPGTFQHSITVANLAAEVANRLEANSMLVRTGALYHDIGKLSDPVFFTENQAGQNPHDQLSTEQSARIIVGHVTEGLNIAEKYDLPQFIKDFIRTHHGAGMAKYFYYKMQNEHPGEEINKDPFSYPGPNPFTKEQAILMMADTAEAASRSLKEYTSENIASLVENLIDQQVNDGYFRECPITFRDITMAKQVLIERLKNIYHTRISYPKKIQDEMDIEEQIEKTFEQNDKATD